MSRAILMAAVASIMPVEHADIMDSYFISDEHPMLVVRNKLTDFHHVLYTQDGEVKNFNVGSDEDFTVLAVAAHCSAPHRVYDIDAALGQWDQIVKEGSEASARYVMSEIEAFNQQQAA